MNGMFDHNRNNVDSIYKNKEVVVISVRQASLFFAALILLFFITFVIGYFWGKKVVIQELNQKMGQENYVDQICSSIQALGEQTPDLNSCDVETGLSSENEKVEPINPVEASSGTVSSTSSEVTQEPIIKEALQMREKDGQRYYAPLIGFGTKKAADLFVRRMDKKGIQLIAKQRHSRTPKGKKIVWYQVVTPPYDDREKLQQLVDRIAKEETIKDISIVTC